MKKWTIVILLFSSSLVAQKPFMLQFTNEKGLTSMTVYQIIQDKLGYIWVGTAKGVSRYDGRKFVNVDLTMLLDKEIIHLSEDSNGRIWINNLSGQIGWIQDMQLHLLELEELPENHLPMRFALKDSVLVLHYMDDGRQLLQLDLNTKQLDLSNGKITKNVQKIDAEIKVAILSKIQKDGRFYFGSTQYQNDTLVFKSISNLAIESEYFTNIDIKNQIEKGEYTIQEIDENGRYYFSNKQWFLSFDKNKNEIKPIYDCSENRINGCLVQDQKIWLFTKKGVIVFNEETLIKELDLLEGINSHVVYKDREENYWLPTSSNGIFLMYNIDSKTYNTDNSILPKSDIQCMYYDTGEQSIYLGLSGALLSKYDIETGNITNFQFPLSGRIVSVEKDSRGSIWVGLDDGIAKLNPSNGAIMITDLPYSCKAIKESSNQEMWYGTSSWASKWDNREIISAEVESDLILGKRISSILEDYEHRILIGTTDGLYIYANDSISNFFEDNGSDKYSVSAIAQTNDSSIWAATANEGLFKIKSDKIVRKYSRQDGLTSNNCRSLFSFKDLLLVGTDNGLSVLNIDTDEITRMNLSDGLSSEEINCAVTNGQKTWIGTPKGLVEMDMNSFQKIDYTTPILMESLKVNGEDHTLDDALKFEYWQNTLDFEYVGIDIKSNQNETYKYRLLGLEDHWLSTSSRIARFHTLPSGDYEFQVKVMNENGVESLSQAGVKFSIETPWWKSIWFYLGSGAFLLLSFGSTIIWRINEIRKRKRIESDIKIRIQKLKSEALKAQMNPHFIYNSLNAIQDFFITNDQESALIFLSKFAHMIRQIFDYSNRDVISLHEEIEFIKLYLDLEKLRFGSRVDIHLEIEDELKDRTHEFDVPPLLLQPVIENVFKHGLMHKLEGGKLLIQFGLFEDQLKCLIEDNGIGRKASKKIRTWKQNERKISGLEAVKERLAIWSDKKSRSQSFEIIDLENSKGEPLGTRIIMII